MILHTLGTQLARQRRWAIPLLLALVAALLWLSLRPNLVDSVTVQTTRLVRSVQFSARVATQARVEVGSTLTARVAHVLVREGAPLASALAQKKRFPPLLAMFSRLGEQTGQLPVMLQRAARQLSSEVQRRAMQLATVLEPLLIVAMGILVMLIVLAVLMPIIQLNQLVR